MKVFLYDRPWAVVPEILMHLRRMEFDAVGLHALAEASARVAAQRSANPPAGVAVLPVHGIIMQRASFFGTSVDEFTQAFRRAMADPQVGAIVLDIDSGGGEVFGVPELADEIAAAGSQKKILASVNSFAGSAAYWLASAASEVAVNPSGKVGSIGMYALHLDFSRELDAIGIKPTLVSAGKFKVAGNEFEPLGEEAHAAIQSDVNKYYEMFIRGVGRGRGKSMKAVREGFGEGRMVMAAAALELGMVDRIATLNETITRALAGVQRSGARAQDPAPKPHCAACGGCGRTVAFIHGEPRINKDEICPACDGSGHAPDAVILSAAENPKESAPSVEKIAAGHENARARARALELA